jgi:type II secretory pathway pseudopilin PulG
MLSNNLMRGNKARGEEGFSLLQLLTVLAIAGVVSAFAIIKIQASRDALNLQNSVRQLAGHIEKARLDAVRRHGTSSVVFANNTAYDVTMDFDGAGTTSTRRYTLQGDISIPTGSPLPTISFNWRGRTSACTNTFAFQNTTGGLQSWVDVSDAGDVTVNSDVDVLPTVSYATVSTTSGISSSAVVTGAGNHNNTLDCDTTTTGASGPPVTGNGSSGCKLIVNPSSISVKKNGGSSATIVLSSNIAGTLTTSSPVNIRIYPGTQSISANGSASFTITSLNTTRGTFALNFTTSCTTVTSLVKVTN